MKELRPADTDSVWKVALWVSMAGFAVLHLAADPRSRDAWAAISAMSLAGVTIISVPAAIISLLTDEPLASVLADSDINSGDPDVLRNMIFVSPERNRIHELADGSYIMHPSLLLDPVIVTAFLTGLPILLWRVRTSLAARLLLGTLCVTLVVVSVPPITTFLEDYVVLPGQIWRLGWPIQLAAPWPDRCAPGLTRRQELLLRPHAGETDGDPAPQYGGLRDAPHGLTTGRLAKASARLRPVDTPSERYVLFADDREKLPG